MSGRYYTPENVAKEMVRIAGRELARDPNHAIDRTKCVGAEGLVRKRVLEPSAGIGGIAEHVPAGANLVVVENSSSAVKVLKQKVRFADVLLGDFMRLPTALKFDVAITNPPYENGRDVSHTGKMLDHAPVVVGLYRSTVPHLASFHAMLREKKARLVGEVKLVGRPRFKGPDDKGETARHDYSILVIRQVAEDYGDSWLEFFSVERRRRAKP